MSKKSGSVRYAEVERETAETRVEVIVDLDGGTRRDISTGVGFFDHMLQLLSFHAGIDVGITAKGDLHVDDHHTVEDVGICLGQAIRRALEGAGGIERYGSFALPMDEALVLVSIDVSGRGVLAYDCEFRRDAIGAFATENVREFFRAFSAHAGMTIHIKKLSGENDHHISEAVFKGFGRALRQAIEPTGEGKANSTKGRID